MYFLPKNALTDLLALWSKKMPVLTPQRPAPGAPAQLLPHSPESRIELDYVNFPKPAPEMNRPETLFTWERNEKTYQAEPEQANGKTTLIFGVRPCDAAGLIRQDNFYLNEYHDPLYAARREHMIVAVLNCSKAGEMCFCAATDSGPFAEAGADLIFTETGNDFLVEAPTAKGRNLLAMAASIFSGQSADQASSGSRPENDSTAEAAPEADPTLFAEHKEKARLAALDSFNLRPDFTDIDKALAHGYGHKLWDLNAAACISCTGCTALCPTCTCFTVVEERTGDNSGRRVRYKDSCQTAGFTRNAGHHNPRSQISRVRYRIMDKLAHGDSRFGLAACVGCGRCIRTCPAGIDITAIATELKQSWVEAGRPEPAAAPTQRYEKIHRGINSFLYTPRVAEITKISQETRDIRRYHLRYKDAKPGESADLSGQFYMLTVFGVGEIAISIPFGDAPGTELEFCIKKTGKVTGALAGLDVGDVVGLRGPYGRGFPYDMLKGRDVLVVGSGVGLAPVRTIIVRMMDHREHFGKIAVIASATSYSGLVYKDDLKVWASMPDVSVQYALSRPTDEVTAHVGYINDLLPALPFNWGSAVALLCASPRRIKLVAADLLNLGMDAGNIYTSLETHMRCGVGKCGHCKVGSHYMCVDGPVFNYKEMLELPQEF